MNSPSEAERPRRWRLPALLLVCALGVVIVAKMQARKIVAQNQIGSVSSVAPPAPARFASGSVAILALREDPLLKLIGEALAARLEGSGHIGESEFHPEGLDSRTGFRGPAVVVTIDVATLVKTPGIWQHGLDATIHVTAGSAPASSLHRSFDALSPPMIDFDWHGTLHHQSTTTGVGSAGTKYQLAAEDIAKQIAGALAKQFDTWHEKYGTLPALPDALYPPYREPESLPLLEAFRPQRLSSYHGLMNHNETFWRLTTERPAVEVITEAQRMMEAAGWKTAHLGVQDRSRTNLRMERGSAVLEVFVAGTFAPRPRVPAGVATDSPPQPPPTIYVRYLDRMTAAELDAALANALGGDLSTDVLLLLADMCRGTPLQRAALEKLESRRLTTPRAWLTLAKLCHALDRGNDAREALWNAHVMLRTVGRRGNLPRQVEDLAKQLEAEELIGRPIDAAAFERLGFIELEPETDLPQLELALDQWAHFFAETSDGRLKTISVCVVEGTSNQGAGKSYQIASSKSLGGSRSWGTISFDPGGGPQGYTEYDAVGGVQFRITKAAGQERFLVDADVLPATHNSEKQP